MEILLGPALLLFAIVIVRSQIFSRSVIQIRREFQSGSFRYYLKKPFVKVINFLRFVPIDTKNLLKCSVVPFGFVTALPLIKNENGLFTLLPFFE